MTRSALSSTLRRGGEVLGLPFIFPRDFAFGVAFALPTKARFPISRWEPVPPAMYSIPSLRTMIRFSNSLAAQGGREPIHKVEDELHPSGSVGLTMHEYRTRRTVPCSGR